MRLSLLRQVHDRVAEQVNLNGYFSPKARPLKRFRQGASVRHWLRTDGPISALKSWLPARRLVEDSAEGEGRR